MYHAGSFYHGQSFVHRIDARVKLAAVIGLSVLILWISGPLSLLLGLALLSGALLSGIRFKTIAEALRPMLIFIVLIFTVHLFFNNGKDSLIRLPYLGISFSASGAQKAFFVTGRFFSLIVAAVLLTMTTPPSHLIAAVKWFLQPMKKLRLPVDEIAVMLALGLRLMPVVFHEKERRETAQKARGYSPERAGFVARIRAFSSLTLSVLLGVFRRADELAAAMEARNFQRGARSSWVELKMTSLDGMVLIIFSALTLFLLALNFCFS